MTPFRSNDTMRRARGVRPVLLVTLLAGLVIRTTHAQGVQPPERLRGVTQVLTQFEESAARRGSGGAAVTLVLSEQQKYPKSTIDSLVVGLESIALASKSNRARMSAAATLVEAGAAEQPIERALERVIALYQRSTDPAVKLTVLKFLPEQKQRSRAIQFLKSIAVQPLDRQDFHHASLTAVETLSHMGTEGRAVITDLRNRGLIKDPSAAGYVEWYFNPRR